MVEAGIRRGRIYIGNLLSIRRCHSSVRIRRDCREVSGVKTIFGAVAELLVECPVAGINVGIYRCSHTIPRRVREEYGLLNQRQQFIALAIKITGEVGNPESSISRNRYPLEEFII